MHSAGSTEGLQDNDNGKIRKLQNRKKKPAEQPAHGASTQGLGFAA